MKAGAFMSFWPSYEMRLFVVSQDASLLHWQDALQRRGYHIDESRKWARLSNQYLSSSSWADVIDSVARVSVGVVDVEDQGQLADQYGLDPGLYLQLVFRLNKANADLAAGIELALFGANGVYAVRTVRRLGGKDRRLL